MASTSPLPKIIVSDCNSTPEISISYHCFGGSRWERDNIIHLSTTYQRIKTLIAHPRCTHSCFKQTKLVIWPCNTCCSIFASQFWDVAKQLLDYFADFFTRDSAAMHAVWFHLVDLWQESAHFFNYRELDKILEEGSHLWLHDARHIFKAMSSQMDTFLAFFKETIELISQLAWGLRGTSGNHNTQDVEIYDPLGERLSPLETTYLTGPWISGIKPWAQFLFNSGPGVIPPSPLPPLETGRAKLSPGEKIISKRYLPLGAIGVLYVHIERDRDPYTARWRARDRPNILEHHHRFDQFSPVFPVPNAPTHSFVSPLLTPREEAAPRRIVSYTLGNGTPPIVRHPTDRYADEEMQAPHPDMFLIDEAVAMCLAIDSYEPHGVVEEGPEEELDDGETNRVFDMWTVVETRVGGGDEEEEGKGRGEEKEVFVLGDMFENFCTVAEVESCLKE